MKRHLLVLMSLLLSNAAFAQASETNPVVFLLDELSGKQHQLFDQELWGRAGTESNGGLLDTIFSSEPNAIELAGVRAAKGGEEPNIVLLSTINARERNSRDFHASVSQIEEILGYEEDPTRWPRMLDLPMCKLYQKRPDEGDRVPISILLVIDDPNARLNCYRFVMTYYAGVRGENGDLVEPVYIDQRAMDMYVSMPPIKVALAFLALKESREANGRYKDRPGYVYAPNEEIFLRAYLTNVGRDAAGTKYGTYQIDLSMELRDEDGTVLSGAFLHSYKGPSTLIFPMDETYFRNDIMAGISLQDRGGYVIAFIFKDASRPALPPAEVVLPIVIE